VNNQSSKPNDTNLTFYSNEILLGQEKYTAIIDGSGVLHDPNGIDRNELLRLAKQRSMINNFDISKLSKDGYRVLVDDMDIKLPTGEVIHNGTQFRNTFHLRPGAYDVFVPCGGRPESVDLSTVGRLIEDTKSTIPYFVEGANLVNIFRCFLKNTKNTLFQSERI